MDEKQLSSFGRTTGLLWLVSSILFPIWFFLPRVAEGAEVAGGWIREDFFEASLVCLGIFTGISILASIITTIVYIVYKHDLD